METCEFRFRNTKENGDLAGATQSMDVPSFDWELFKNLPNAELFVRRAYKSLLQKLVRDLKLGYKNGTSAKELLSLEAVITRSFHFKKTDIARWCEERDWNSLDLKSPETIVPTLKKLLPKYAYRDDVITDEEQRRKVAQLVAGISDRKKDDIAEYLWVKLTQVVPENDGLLMEL